MAKRATSVVTDAERKARDEYLKNKDIEEATQLEEDRKNRRFTQVYEKGWDRIEALYDGYPGAGKLYAFLAKNLDPSCGAVICDQQFLADKLDASVRTVRRWIDYLEEKNALVKIPVSNGSYAYALDPAEVWKGFNTSKDYAAFLAKTLVNQDGEIMRRLQTMFSNQEEKKKQAKQKKTG